MVPYSHHKNAVTIVFSGADLLGKVLQEHPLD